MACGAIRAVNGVNVICDNAGTSTHSGLHSGLLNYNFFGRVWSSTRVYWSGAASRTVAQKPAVLGESDFVMPSNQSVVPQVSGITAGGTTVIDETTIVKASGLVTVPVGAPFVELIMLSGGTGGYDSSWGAASGGAAGVWTAVTLVRGTDFWSGLTQFNVLIGTGGGKNYGLPSATSVTFRNAANSADVSRVATLPVGGTSGMVPQGAGVVDFSYNDITYTGGGIQQNASGAGITPGGGGAGGGGGFGGGGPGAPGQVWIRART
ncbi:hypothetical protein KHO57_gp219 [Mycobacterium phage Phabba]|uniref:Glycine-rich domain-containing protein n=1 Tax=Mycobacterium phage Phabba TaxID=2027899 RepID=A0A249XSG5_9CAUD|nr:hypothetical protein KHO57_gp219 [Mycobacterium phage Phabba]ASZ74685.1 hypothetical protein SEA_PHABBA_116 [Mycobacterium phage Phabba]